jgi:2-polyprenyl-6-methoxyphenol hydroxylase-like FAD-dependent oxidoreductase
MDIHVNGAGITGPAAALALAAAGNHVTVHETRLKEEVFSTGVIGITEENCDALRPYDVDLNDIAQDNMYYEWSTDGVQSYRYSTEKFVVWTDLHNVLVNAAERHGAKFIWGKPGVDHGVRVQASGLGYASHRGLHATPRYVVYRGVSAVNTDFAWLSMNDPGKRFAFKLAHTPVGGAWELYVHREHFALHSQHADSLPDECKLLPEIFSKLIDATISLDTNPISDWEIAQSLITRDGLTAGDANGGLRPHTGSGANIGIKDALATPRLLDGDRKLEAELIKMRQFQHERGIALGRKVMGT